MMLADSLRPSWGRIANENPGRAGIRGNITQGKLGGSQLNFSRLNSFGKLNDRLSRCLVQATDFYGLKMACFRSSPNSMLSDTKEASSLLQ